MSASIFQNKKLRHRKGRVIKAVSPTDRLQVKQGRTQYTALPCDYAGGNADVEHQTAPVHPQIN